MTRQEHEVERRNTGLGAGSISRLPPQTRRGKRTRSYLVAAARRVFEREGYLDAGITDMTVEAGVATGTFYTYFSNKEEIFKAVLDEVQEEMFHPNLPRVSHSEDLVKNLEDNNRAYFESYRRNADLMRLLEQVATINSSFRDMRRGRGEKFERRNAAHIQALQDAGLVDPELDPMMASIALSGMVGRLAYIFFVLNDDDPDIDALVAIATRLWVNGLRFEIVDPANSKSEGTKTR